MGSTKRAVLITTFGNFLAPLVGLVTAPILAQGLGVEGRGLVAAATAPLLLATNIATLGLPDALIYLTVRRGPGYQRFVTHVLVFLGLVGIAVSGAIAWLSNALSAGDSELAFVISCAGLALSPSLVLAGLRGIATGYQAWMLVTCEKLINSTARLVFIVCLFITDCLTVLTGTIAMASTTFVGLIVYAWLPSVARKYHPAEVASPNFRFLSSFTLRVWFGSLSGILLFRLSQMLMVPLSGAYQLGLFVVAVTISEMVLIFNSAVSTVMYSKETRSNDTEALAAATRISTLVTAGGAGAIAAISPWAVPYFFGDDFQYAIAPLWVLLVGVVLGNTGSVAGAGLIARGRPGLRSLSLGLALVCSTGSLVLLAPALGALGASIATLIGNVVAGGMNIVWLRLCYGIAPLKFIGTRRTDIRYLVREMPALGRRRKKVSN